jgi:hypothetical protein
MVRTKTLLYTAVWDKLEYTSEMAPVAVTRPQALT